MDQLTIKKLKMLKATHPKTTKSSIQLKVYYGWAKLNKIQKRKSLVVAFENEGGAGSETSRSGKTLRKAMSICHERDQTEKEMKDAQGAIRCFTMYNIFMDNKAFKGSLRAALQVNFEADKNHVSEEERNIIRKKLEMAFRDSHPNYVEPNTI